MLLTCASIGRWESSTTPRFFIFWTDLSSQSPTRSFKGAGLCASLVYMIVIEHEILLTPEWSHRKKWTPAQMNAIINRKSWIFGWNCCVFFSIDYCVISELIWHRTDYCQHRQNTKLLTCQCHFIWNRIVPCPKSGSYSPFTTACVIFFWSIQPFVHTIIILERPILKLS